MAEPAAYAFMPRRKRDIGDDEFPDISDTASEDDEEEVGVTANSPSLPVECTRDIKLVEPASQEKCVLKLASVAEAISDTAIKLAWRQAQKNDGYRQPEMLQFAIMENNHFRYHGYRNYISFIHGHLGKHRRLVIPDCVTKHLRHRFPDPK